MFVGEGTMRESRENNDDDDDGEIKKIMSEIIRTSDASDSRVEYEDEHHKKNRKNIHCYVLQSTIAYGRQSVYYMEKIVSGSCARRLPKLENLYSF